MILHDLAWLAGIGSLLCFFVALVKPVWFLGEEPAPTDAGAEETYTMPISTI